MASQPNERNHIVAGLDIGGSSIKHGLVDAITGELSSEPGTMPITESFTPAHLTETVRRCLALHNWDGPMGVGYPGVVIDGVARSGAHVDPAFIGVNWLETLKTLTAGPVVLLNDADAAGTAEMKFGAGKEYNSSSGGTVLVITLGTGIGSAVFHGGKLLPNTEFGHMLMGDIEAEDLAAGSVKVREGLEWGDYGARLGRFLAELEKLLTPELIVIGGGISEDFAHFAPYLDLRTRTVPARFRNRAGLIGAALAVDLGNGR